MLFGTTPALRRALPVASLLGLSACGPDLGGAPAAHYACAPPDSAPSTEHPRATEYQALLDEVVQGGLPGAAVLLRSADGQVWAGAGGKADMASGVDMQACNRIRAGSITKTFTATLVMMLAEDGALDLDDRIDEHLDAPLLLDIPNGDVATVRQLLAHTSGIPDYTNLAFLLGQVNDSAPMTNMEDSLDLVRGAKADFAPGEGWAYSNTNYELAGYVVEKASGQDFEDMLRERILEPLDLTRTNIHLDGTTPDGTVRGYMDWHGDGLVFDVSDYTMAHTSPAGAVVTTVYDLATFLEALFAGDVISDDSLAQMQVWRETAPDGVESDFLYGIGLMMEDTDHGPAIGHTGGVFGFTSAMTHYPETGATAVMLVNGSLGRINEAFANELQPAIPGLLHD